MSYEVVDGVRDGARRAWDVTESAATSAKSTVESAAQTAAQGARSGFLEGLEKVTKIAGVVRAFGLDDALFRVGLQRRRSFFADLGVFGAGFTAGAAVTMLSTPLSGRAMRGRLIGFFGELVSKGEEVAAPTVEKATDEVTSMAHDVRDAATHQAGVAKQSAIHAKETVDQAKQSVAAKVHHVTDSVLGDAKRDEGAAHPGRGN